MNIKILCLVNQIIYLMIRIEHNEYYWYVNNTTVYITIWYNILCKFNLVPARILYSKSLASHGVVTITKYSAIKYLKLKKYSNRSEKYLILIIDNNSGWIFGAMSPYGFKINPRFHDLLISKHFINYTYYIT